MIVRPEPLPSRKKANFGEYVPIAPGSSRKFIQVIDPKTPEGQKVLQEARANATPKSVYVRAILRHCRACFGTVPVRKDCGGGTLRDGTTCNLYAYNTAKKCRHSTKTALKGSIRRECSYCGGQADTCGDCSLQKNTFEPKFATSQNAVKTRHKVIGGRGPGGLPPGADAANNISQLSLGRESEGKNNPPVLLGIT
jgi:hypothetical protein